MFHRIFGNYRKKTNVALVINWEFHQKDHWVSIFAPYFVNAFVKEFNPIIINSQFEYALYKKKIKHIVSMEPGWAAPKIKYDKKMDHTVAVFASDPHNKTDWFQEYVLDNDITYVLSQYKSPFFYHFPSFPKERFIHFPWAVPDQLVPQKEVKYLGSDIMIFGGQSSDAYDVRNWCREQKYITGFDNSGVENKKLSNTEYSQWLSTFDAIVAAGSSNPMYDLVTPKYFEIGSVGALIIGQECQDLKSLGFDDSNMVIFKKENFNNKIEQYLKSPKVFEEIRKKGRSVVLGKHLISHRLDTLKKLLLGRNE